MAPRKIQIVGQRKKSPIKIVTGDDNGGVRVKRSTTRGGDARRRTMSIPDVSSSTRRKGRGGKKFRLKKGASVSQSIPEPVPELVPELVDPDRYEMKHELGRGGTGVVYLATDRLLNTDVAIKVLDDELTSDEDVMNSFFREARIALSLLHQNIVRLFNLERQRTSYYLVMEYVSGSSLSRLLREHGGYFPLDFVSQLLDVMVGAVSYAHGLGVVHRDLKPSNVMISDEGILKIIDFGVSNLLGTQDEQGFIEGTPEYMSPEQTAGHATDGRTDVYALAVIVYELLTGQTRYPRGATADEILACEPLPLQGLPEPLIEVLDRAMAQDMTHRTPGVEQFHAEFNQAVSSLGHLV